jgi:prolyl 4-hydroxylase
MNNHILPPRFARGFPFQKVKIPEDLYSKITEEYKTMNFDVVVDNVEYSPEYGSHTVAAISVKKSPLPYYNFCPISEDLKDHCYETITPLIQQWSNCELEQTWSYGIRSYIKNSVLHLHRDRFDTHIISCIIFIDEKSSEKWPLDFFDHDFNHHKVVFEPGEMLFYESLCAHGRLTPFNGEYYRNMYFHWRPKNWDNEHLYGLKTTFNGMKEYYSFYGK